MRGTRDHHDELVLQGTVRHHPQEVERLLTDTQMRVDRCITSGASQVLVLAVWNVQMSLGVTVLLCKTEIDDVDLVSALANPHQEVVGLDITVDEIAGMDILNARD